MVKFGATILVFVFTAFICGQFVMPLQRHQEKQMKKPASHKAGASDKACCMNKPVNKQKKNTPKNCSDCPLSVKMEFQKIFSLQPDVIILSTQYEIMQGSALSGFSYRQIKTPVC